MLGEASYTLIDDNGVEFYLSPKDKSNRRKQGLDDGVKKVTLKEDPVYLDENHQYHQSAISERLPLQNRIDDDFSNTNLNGNRTINTTTSPGAIATATNGFDLNKVPSRYVIATNSPQYGNLVH